MRVKRGEVRRLHIEREIWVVVLALIHGRILPEGQLDGSRCQAVEVAIRRRGDVVVESPVARGDGGALGQQLRWRDLPWLAARRDQLWELVVLGERSSEPIVRLNQRPASAQTLWSLSGK